MLKSNRIISRLDPAKTTKAYDTYWKFAFERQNIFYKRISVGEDLYTTDFVLQTYKFTNVYRACDRVSQFLIRNVIYDDVRDRSPSDILFRIMLFKLFNKIETWLLLENEFGDLSLDNFEIDTFKRFLDEKMNSGTVLYSNAYMMASGCKEFKVTRKHHSHLLLLDLMSKNRLADQIISCKKMHDAYSLLLDYPLIGRFLAYQYITDINYSPLTDFSESEFTVPGPGARDGIRKCFSSLGGLSETEIIKMMTDRQEYEFDRLGLRFRRIGERPLQYIDIQNIFCEVDKYCRVVHPEIQGLSGRTRIKQKFKPNGNKIDYFFPPKWGIKLGV